MKKHSNINILKLPDAILFDTDNTLYPYSPAHEKAMSAIKKKFMENDTVEQNGKSFAVVENMVKNNPGWRLSLQTHKWMGVL